LKPKKPQGYATQTALVERALTEARDLEPDDDETDDYRLFMLLDFANWMLTGLVAFFETNS
jgi:hypothetical protein